MAENEPPTWDWQPRDHASTESAAGSREWQLIEKLVTAQTREQRRRRRWGIFFKLVTLGYVGVLMYSLLAFNSSAWNSTTPVSTPHVAVVDLSGQIGTAQPISHERFRQPLINAFNAPGARAVVLKINSPGGSPVQAQRLHQLILDLKAMPGAPPTLALLGDVAASGGYYLAVAADDIIAAPASLVGSIGVVSGGFGLDDVLAELGVDRRLYTAGEHKAFLDMFSPEDPEAVAHWQAVLDSVYRQFEAAVRTGRGERLDTDNPDVISGYLWSGEQAVANGLIDATGSLRTIQADLGLDEVVHYQPERDPWQKMLDQIGPGLAATLTHTLGQWLGVESGPELR